MVPLVAIVSLGLFIAGILIYRNNKEKIEPIIEKVEEVASTVEADAKKV